MKVYVLVEASAGEEPVGFDNLQLFTSPNKAQKALKKRYKDVRDSIIDYGTITDDDFGEGYYTLVLEEDDCTTTFEGRIFEKELKVNL